ncbi:MAG: trypsin-like peptidase domain-containing protein [Bacteroidia bacterium]|nr:trypsin-like peptidase domain-containing protein [Bacteroidia bacterium]
MTLKKFALYAGGALLLMLFSSTLGALIYKNYFETPTYYYFPQESLPTSFSHYIPENTETKERIVDQDAPVGTSLPDFVQASSLARPAVVHIRSRYEAHSSNRNADFFSNPFRNYLDEDGRRESPQGMASGSGVLISPNGYIATNNHVIEDADEVEVTLFDNRSFKAEVIGTDLATDLALLKIKGEELPFLSFGDSDQVQVGQWVLAVGNPMDLTSTVTAGIVSAKGRNINLLQNDSKYAIESFIQTDAAVNKGNSGGALVDKEGKLIGINTAIASRTGYYAGYSFAIPATIAKKVMEDLLTFKEVKRGFLGVSIQQVNATLAKQHGLSMLKGAYVTDVRQELGAHDAGIRVGDVIVSVNEIEVSNSSELQEQVSRYRPGDKVKILAYRGNQKRLFSVLLKSIEGEWERVNRLGFLEYNESKFRLLGLSEYEEFDVENGIMVMEAGEEMETGGIQDGFVITEVDGKKVYSLKDLKEAFDKSGDYVTFRGLYSKGAMASFSFSW